MADKKNDPHAIKPNNKLPFIAGGMILFALAWLVYGINPGGALRKETEDEKKERLEAVKEAEHRKRQAAKDAAREAARVK